MDLRLLLLGDGACLGETSPPPWFYHPVQRRSLRRSGLTAEETVCSPDTGDVTAYFGVRFSYYSGVKGSGADFSFGRGDCNDLSSSSFVADCICFGFRSTGLICLSGVVCVHRDDYIVPKFQSFRQTSPSKNPSKNGPHHHFVKKRVPTYLTLLTSLLLVLHLTFVACTTIPLGSVLYVTGSNQSSWSSPNSTFSVSFVPSSSPGSFLAAVSFAGNVTVWSAGSVDSRGSLRLLPSGSLRLISGSNTTAWDSGTDGLGVVSATIDDSGELRLFNNRSITVWSSFDHPTDTVVQSQNFTAGMVLRSGDYSSQLERRGNLTLKWNNSTTYWSQGLNSSLNMSLSSLSLHTNGLLLIFDSTHSGGAEIIYSVDYGEGSNNFMFLKLDDDGNLRIYSSATRNNGPMTARWSAVADQCLVYGYCGNFGICTYNDNSPICLCPSRNFDHVDENDKRKGCKRRVELSDCFDNATMVDLDHTRLITDPADPNSEVGSSSCGSNCLLSSTCLASVSLSDGSGSCWQKQSGGSLITGYESPLVKTTSYVKVCGPVLPNKPLVATKDDRKSSKLKLILGVLVASVVMIIIMVAVIVRAKNARKIDWSGENIEEIVMLKHYSYARVKKMTNSFANALGKGGFGTVYKGKLPDGNQDVAVKILKESLSKMESFSYKSQSCKWPKGKKRVPISYAPAHQMQLSESI
ncbi:hypothetical protein F2Q69_00046751 [Brassica cretica]|uniref:non-specific serine/threonine protein kinase n=1 Tax=Brassica cretica TaxID=69181 RepID=A0A8S9PTW4_BRACR|nr:hypothetical protein F2Q69_00046751 [Brassica cretica]